MTAENVFKFAKAYKFFYQGKYDFKKYGGVINTPPLIKQHDRRFYHRIAQKLNDAQIHALFTLGFYHHPNAYIADLSTPDAFSAAIAFAARAENGRTVLEHDLYELSKRLVKLDVDAWLYGEIIGGTRSSVPGCLQDVASGDLPLDVACLLLLIPQKELDYAWTKEMQSRPALFGNGAEKLLQVDQLIMRQRTGWRILTHELAREFWAQMNYKSLAPKQVEQTVTLF